MLVFQHEESANNSFWLVGTGASGVLSSTCSDGSGTFLFCLLKSLGSKDFVSVVLISNLLGPFVSFGGILSLFEAYPIRSLAFINNWNLITKVISFH